MDIAWPKVIPVLLSIAIIIFIALISENSRFVAGITATMPLSVPLSMWIVYANAERDQRALQEYTNSLGLGLIALLAFMAAIWFATNRMNAGLWQSVGLGYAAWAIVVGVAAFIR